MGQQPCYIDDGGYRRIKVGKRYVLEHVYVWEQAHGKTPRGYEVHHKDLNKLNNSLENLELLDPLTHRRLHHGYQLRAGEWFKQCPTCETWKHVSQQNWYMNRARGTPARKECKDCVKAQRLSGRGPSQRLEPGLPYLTVAEAARELRLGEGKVRALFDEGVLEGDTTSGGHRRILSSSVSELRRKRQAYSSGFTLG